MTARIQGQVIREVTPKGPADRAGLAPGDVILGLGASSIFSRDDIEDLLRVSRPGQKLAARVIRGKTSQRETVTLELGGRKASPRSGIPWEHAGLVQLRSAQARARKDRRRVLVGLSGAET